MVNRLVSFAFPLEGTLALQILNPSHQRVFSKAWLRDRWSKLANAVPSEVREVERKQYGISFFFLLSNEKCMPKVNRKQPPPELFCWGCFHRPPEPALGEGKKGRQLIFRNRANAAKQIGRCLVS